MNLFIKNKLTIEHIRAKRFVAIYVQTIIRNCKDANFLTIN